ncbi:hypothetical protein ABZ517_05730 [Streptomyces scabiei]|uniref:hypothetical protein n=1 Tax=Streptomyces scabiei TaxID=1930 RepID=UPI0033DAC2E8
MPRRFPPRPKNSFAELADELKNFDVPFKVSADRPAFEITNERWEGRLILWLDEDANEFKAEVRARDEEHHKPAHWAPRGYNAWYFVREFWGLKDDEKRTRADVCNFCRKLVTEIETTCPDAQDGIHSPNPFLCPSCGEMPDKKVGWVQEIECENCATKLVRKDNVWKLR